MGGVPPCQRDGRAGRCHGRPTTPRDAAPTPTPPRVPHVARAGPHLRGEGVACRPGRPRPDRQKTRYGTVIHNLTPVLHSGGHENTPQHQPAANSEGRTYANFVCVRSGLRPDTPRKRPWPHDGIEGCRIEGQMGRWMGRHRATMETCCGRGPLFLMRQAHRRPQAGPALRACRARVLRVSPGHEMGL